MIDWYARIFFKAGRAHGWDLMFGAVWEPSRPDSLVEGETVPAALMVRFLLWWVEITYKSSEELRNQALRIHSGR